MKKCNVCKVRKPNFWFKKKENGDLKKLVEVVNEHGGVDS